MASGAAAAIAQAVTRQGASEAAVAALARTLRAERPAADAALEAGAAWALWRYLAGGGADPAEGGEESGSHEHGLPAAGLALLGLAQTYGAETAWGTARAGRADSGPGEGTEGAGAGPGEQLEQEVAEPDSSVKLTGLVRLLSEEPRLGCELVEALVQQAEPSGRAELGALLMQDGKLVDRLVAGLPRVAVAGGESEGESEPDAGEGGEAGSKSDGAACARALAALFQGVRSTGVFAKTLLERGTILQLKRAMLAGPQKARVAAAYLLESLCEASLECTRSTLEHGGLDSMKALLPKPAWEPPPLQGDEGGQEKAIDQEIDIDDTLLGDMLLDEEEMIAQGEEKEAEDQAAAEAAAKAEEVRKQNALPSVEGETDDPRIIAAVLGVLRAATTHAAVRRDVYEDTQLIPPHVIYLHCIYGGAAADSAEEAGGGAENPVPAPGEEGGAAENLDASGGGEGAGAAPGDEGTDGQEVAEGAEPEGAGEQQAGGEDSTEAGAGLRVDPAVQEAALAALKPLLQEPEIAAQIGQDGLFTEWLLSEGLPDCSPAQQQQLLELLPQLRSEANEKNMGKAITALGPKVAAGHKVLQTHASWAMFCLPEADFHARYRPPPESPPPSPPPPPLATSKFLWDALGRPDMIDGLELGEPGLGEAGRQAAEAGPPGGQPVPAQ